MNRCNLDPMMMGKEHTAQHGIKIMQSPLSEAQAFICHQLACIGLICRSSQASLLRGGML